MKMKLNLLYLIPALMIACSAPKTEELAAEEEVAKSRVVTVEVESFIDNPSGYEITNEGVNMDSIGWLSFDVKFDIAGRYKTEVIGRSESGAKVWVEDYIDNTDDRNYDVSGRLEIPIGETFASTSVDGSPFDAVVHKMKLNLSDGSAEIDKIVFTLLREHQETTKTLTQSMDGTEWVLAWSDEFDGSSLDTSKWIYDFGDWGWGNNELQYYTDSRTENTRIEDGVLVIEARKDDVGAKWTSARLTTRGKQSFLYGKIEFKARVPSGKGNWTAGWTLGAAYVDEIDWPYCGEIDIMESVGYEVNDETGDGIAHCSMHTPAYYFKKETQITSKTEVENISGEFHTYAVEWTPEEIRGYVDDKHYYTYAENANELEWPFDQPQNIILNLAMGGGWGGAQGMDETLTSQKLEIDYVRVYELK